MHISVYNGEMFERGIVWKIVMWFLFLVLLFLTFFSSRFLTWDTSWVPKWSDIFSSILLVLLFCGYWWYVRVQVEEIILVRISEDGLWIGENLYRWHAVQGYYLEKSFKEQSYTSIVLVVNNTPEVHSLFTSEEELIAFSAKLQEKTTYLEDHEMHRFARFLRRIKL